MYVYLYIYEVLSACCLRHAKEDATSGSNVQDTSRRGSLRVNLHKSLKDHRQPLATPVHFFNAARTSEEAKSHLFDRLTAYMSSSPPPYFFSEARGGGGGWRGGGLSELPQSLMGETPYHTLFLLCARYEHGIASGCGCEGLVMFVCVCVCG